MGGPRIPGFDFNLGNTASSAAADDARRTEQAARDKGFNDALTDRTVDEETRREIEALYRSGAPSTTIASTLAAAREGKGIYAVRRVKANMLALRKDMPGRSQLMSPLALNPDGGGTYNGGTR